MLVRDTTLAGRLRRQAFRAAAVTVLPFGLLAATTATTAAAQEAFEEPIASERPTFSSSTQVLPRGRFQVEGGFDIASFEIGAGDADVTTLPLALLRYGLNGNIELQAGWAGLSFVDTPGGGDDTRTNDLQVNAKIGLSDGAAGSLSLLTGIRLPTGDGPASGVTPSAGLVWDHALNDRLGLFGQATVIVDALFDDTALLASNAIGVTRTIAGNWAVFAEHFLIFGEDISTSNTLDVGTTYRVAANLQVDAILGFGLGDADGTFFGAGVAYRW